MKISKFINTKGMIKNLLTVLIVIMVSNLAWMQSAEPALSGANFVPNQIEVGDTSILNISFANSGFSAIPAQSIELTISVAFSFYDTEPNPPSGIGGSLFNWTYLGQGLWRGINTNSIAAFGGGDIVLKVIGTAESVTFEATNINVQPIANFTMFDNSPSNDNLQPELKIDPNNCMAGNSGPSLSATSVNNNCPALVVDLDSYHTGTVPSGTELVWSSSASISNELVSSVVSGSGTYYAFYKDELNNCNSPSSGPLTVIIEGCNGTPVAGADLAITSLNDPVTIDVLDNDVDPENHTLSITQVNTSNQGVTPQIVNGMVIYTPPVGFSGVDVFTYTVCDNGSPVRCSSTSVTVTVTDVLTFQNQCPNLYVDIADIHEGALPAGNQLIWSSDDDPSDGISPVFGSKIYNSTTVYVYYFDPIGGCYSPGIEANIEVNSCNDAPIAVNDSNSGEEDETQVGNVGMNDSDPNNDNLTFTLVDGVDNGTLTLNPDGSYTYTPDVEFAGTDQFTYRVCDDGVPQLCDMATVTLTVTVVDFICVDINAKVLLEGMIVSPDGDLNYLPEMRTDMNDLRLLPGQSFSNGFAGEIAYSPKGQPYNVRPWLYNGNEGDFFDSQGNANNGDAGYPNSVVDWVLVSLRQNENDEPSSIVCQEAVLLHKDGTLEMVTPCCGVDRRKEYFIVVEHRNHLLIMSPQKVDMTRVGSQSDQVKYSVYHDFSLNNSYQTVDPNFNTKIGFGQKQLPDGRWVMIGGNGEQELTHDDTDLTVDDEVVWGDQNSNVNLYLIGDFNLNGDINFNDRVLWEENNGLFSSVPRDKNQ